MTGHPTLVVGASSGLGRAIAIELGRRRRPVILLARDAARLDEARGAALAAGAPSASVAIADVRDGAALGAALAGACGATPLAAVVHAAGVLKLGAVDALDAADLRLMLDVNVAGAASVVRACLPRWRREGGHLAIVSSIAGRLALPGGFAAYGASKWALRGWAEIARPELAARGIHLTVAYPSILDTEMVAAQRGADAPAVYRAFPWHSPERAARRLLDDMDAGRRESFVSASDRLAAWAAGAFPVLFDAGLRATLRLRASERTR